MMTQTRPGRAGMPRRGGPADPPRGVQGHSEVVTAASGAPARPDPRLPPMPLPAPREGERGATVMASPGHHHTLIHLQNCMDAAEEAAIGRWKAECQRPLRALLVEIVVDGARA